MPVDPTGTTTIRRRYERAAVRRFRRIATLARRAIVEVDSLGIAARRIRTGDVAIGDAEARAGQFAGHGGSAAKARAFSEWLRRQSDFEVLDLPPSAVAAANDPPPTGPPRGRAANRPHWSRTFVAAAYRKGLRDAVVETGRAPRGRTERIVGAEFLGPVHARRAEILYARNLHALAGVSRETSAAVRDVLARGLIEGRAPRVLARIVTNRVAKVGIVRARTIARTEIIRAHAEATLTYYEEAGVEVVRQEAEFATSGDNRVCPICAGMEGDVHLIEEARGIIPVHPNCRCRWLPILP